MSLSTSQLQLPNYWTASSSLLGPWTLCMWTSRRPVGEVCSGCSVSLRHTACSLSLWWRDKCGFGGRAGAGKAEHPVTDAWAANFAELSSGAGRSGRKWRSAVVDLVDPSFTHHCPPGLSEGRCNTSSLVHTGGSYTGRCGPGSWHTASPWTSTTWAKASCRQPMARSSSATGSLPQERRLWTGDGRFRSLLAQHKRGGHLHLISKQSNLKLCVINLPARRRTKTQPLGVGLHRAVSACGLDMSARLCHSLHLATLLLLQRLWIEGHASA